MDASGPLLGSADVQARSTATCQTAVAAPISPTRTTVVV
jgi:hypothetical protein